MPTDNPIKVTLNQRDLEDSRKIWKIFNNIYLKKEKELKRRALNSYLHVLRDKYGLKVTPLYHYNFYFLYFHISTDGNLHYEFLFNSSNEIKVCLHFEAGHFSKNDIIDACLENLKIRDNLKSEPFPFG